MRISSTPDFRIRISLVLASAMEILLWTISVCVLTLLASYSLEITDGQSVILDAAENALGPALWNLLGWAGLVLAVTSVLAGKHWVARAARNVLLAAYGVGLVAIGVLLAITFRCHHGLGVGEFFVLLVFFAAMALTLLVLVNCADLLTRLMHDWPSVEGLRHERKWVIVSLFVVVATTPLWQKLSPAKLSDAPLVCLRNR
jgi:hypothetical protein